LLNAQDEAFAQLAARRGLLTPAQLQAARDLRTEVGADGPIAQLLLQGKVLAPAIVAALLRDLTRGYFTCERCADRAPYDALGRLERLACPRCGGALGFVDPSAVDGGALAATGPRATGRHPTRPTGGHPSYGGYAPPPTSTHPTGAHPAVSRPSGKQSMVPPDPAPAPAPAVPPPEAWDAEATVMDRNRRKTGAIPLRGAAPPARGQDPVETLRERTSTGKYPTHAGQYPTHAQGQYPTHAGPPPAPYQTHAGAPPGQYPTHAGPPPAQYQTHAGAPPGLDEDPADSTVRDGRVLGLPGAGERMVGPYTLAKEIGRGAGGVIFLAHRAGLERRFAVKVLLGGMLGDEDAVKRFQLEAAVASKIDDPGIVTVFDTGCDGGRYYYAMEYCPGQTLEARLAKGALEPTEAARIILSLARTMQAAHERNVIHRDLKPANVIIEEGTGRPRVMDFGVARDPSLLRSLSRTGQLLGTPVYMAPEQLLGARDVDARVDVYSLGVMLYELVSGKRPHSAPTTVLLAERVAHEDAKPLRELAPGAPAPLEAICGRALARDRDARYESARALARDLERFLAGRDVVAASPRRRGGARRRLVIAGAAGALLLLIALIVGWRVHVAREDAAAEARRQEAVRAEALRKQEALEQAAALRRALDERRRPLAALQAEAAALVARPDAPPGAATLAKALDALVALRGASARPIAAVVEDLDAAIEAARDDVGLQAELHLGLAEHLRRRAQQEQAITHAERAIAEPGRLGLEARFVRASALWQLERDGAAREAFDALARDDPQGPLGLLARSCAVGRERPEEGLATARRALELEPGLVAARMQAAACLYRADRAPEALSEVEAYVREAPDDQQGHALRGVVLLLRGRLDDGIAAFERAIALGEPRPSPNALMARAEALLAKNEQARALVDLDRSIELRPEARALFLRGVVHEQSGRSTTAEADWQQANALDPRAVELLISNTQSPRLRRRVRQALGQPDYDGEAPGLRTGEVTPELEQRLARRAEAAPATAREPLQEALLRAARGQAWRDVQAQLTVALRFGDDSVHVALEALRLALGRDAHEPAGELLARARALGASGHEVERLDAEAQLRRGRISEAVRRYRTLAGRDPSGVEGLCAVGEAERLTGRLPQAIEAVEAALRVDGDHVPSLALKAELLLSVEPPDTRAALEAVSRGLSLVGAADSRLLVGRFRCMALVALRELREAGRSGPDPGAQRRIGVALGEMRTLLACSEGAGPRVAVAMILLDAPETAIRVRARELLVDATRLDPERADLELLLGRLELLVGRQDLQTILGHWRKARGLEPLQPLPARFVAEFRQVFGDRPELDALVEPR
jgi:tetratricopeptide (TPR) repeat protein